MARPSLKKRLLTSLPARTLISLIVSLMVRVLYGTARVDKQFPESLRPYMAGELPAVFCFWHGRMIMHPFAKPPKRAMYVLISRHNDGALITATMRWFGIDSVRGSTGRNSASALLNMLKVKESGGNICITPDGPRGPFQKAAQGAAYVAAKTGYPIIPVTFSASRHWRFRSWDKFMLPRPFARIQFVADACLTITSEDETSIRATTDALEQALVRITAEADRLCGVAV